MRLRARHSPLKRGFFLAIRGCLIILHGLFGWAFKDSGKDSGRR